MHIEYAGNAPGIRRWPGQFTKYRYPFGTDRRHGKVDIRDGIKFIEHLTAGGADRIWKLYRA